MESRNGSYWYASEDSNASEDNVCVLVNMAVIMNSEVLVLIRSATATDVNASAEVLVKSEN